MVFYLHSVINSSKKRFISSILSIPKHFLIVSNFYDKDWSYGMVVSYSLILSSTKKSTSSINIPTISIILSSEILKFSSSSSIFSFYFFLSDSWICSSSSFWTGTHSFPNYCKWIVTSHLIILSFNFLTSSSFIFIISLYLSESAFSKCLNFLYSSLNYLVILLYS